MIPDQEVVYPDVSEPVFFPTQIEDFKNVLPFVETTRWTCSSPRFRERIVPPNKFHFKTLSDVPPPSQLNKSYSVEMLLAFQHLFTTPTDDVIEVFLRNPTVKGEKRIKKYVEENILISLAISNWEYSYRFPNKETGFVTSSVPIPKKRKKSKKKANVSFKVPVNPKISRPATYQIEKTSELMIKPNPDEVNVRIRTKTLINTKCFFKKFKCILNKVTLENMDIMKNEVRFLGEEWSEEILQIAVSLIHANVIRNAAFAPVYSEFALRISDLFPGVDIFKKLILDHIKKTLNLNGKLECEPKDSIFLSKRMKKVNISNLLGELFLKNLVDMDDIFKVCREFIVARSEDISGFRDLCLECLVVLVRICGRKLFRKDEETLEDMMAQLAAMLHDENIPKRIRFLLDDVVELGNNAWISPRSEKELQPQRICDLRANFLVKPPFEKNRSHLKSSTKYHRSGKPHSKFKKSYSSRRLPLKSKKMHMKERGLLKKSRSRALASPPSFPGGVIKSKMNYRMAARTAAEKRQNAAKQQIFEKVETVVKSMDPLKMEKFAANNPSWRTYLLQRLLRK